MSSTAPLMQDSLIDFENAEVDGKKHVCSRCLKSFNQGNHLKRHMLTHTGEKPHVCQMCSRKFSRNDALKRHMQLVHSAEKPQFVCRICSRNFAIEDDLKVHSVCHDLN